MHHYAIAGGYSIQEPCDKLKCYLFEWITVQPGFTIFLPFRKIAMWNRWSGAGFILSKSAKMCRHQEQKVMLRLRLALPVTFMFKG